MAIIELGRQGDQAGGRGINGCYLCSFSRLIWREKRPPRRQSSALPLAKKAICIQTLL